MNKKLYVMVGLPASGKSTYIDNISGDFVILSTDNFLEKKAKELDSTYSIVYKKYISEAEKELKNSLSFAVANDKDIVWDQTNLRVKKRKTILNSVPKDYHKIAIEFFVPMDVIEERLETRAKNTGKYVGFNIVKSMDSTREIITDDEPFDEHIIIKYET